MSLKNKFILVQFVRFTYLELWSRDDDVNRAFSGFNRHIFYVNVLAEIQFL